MQLSLLWTFNRTMDRVPYLLTGIALFLVKFLIDWCVAATVFDQPWSPLDYLVWPNDGTLRVLDLTDPQRAFALTMLLLSLPFIWCGVVLTLHRLRAAGLPLALVVLFFVPIVNLLLFLVLSLLPTKPFVYTAELVTPEGEINPYESPLVDEGKFRRLHRKLAGDSYWRSGLISLSVCVPLAVLGVILGAELLQSYGFSLFVGGPFSLGMISVLIFGFSRPQPLAMCLAVALGMITLAGAALLVVALEGAICLIMAAPIVYFLTFLGAMVGYAIQTRPWLTRHHAGITMLLLLALPGLMAAEASREPLAAIRTVQTVVIINAPPEQVWPLVIEFPPLAEPNDWLFRAGVAYPLRATINGTGPGAIRHCEFSTGTFVEPIEVWEEPSLMRFSVSDQPHAMEEWSPYPIHPAHLDHYLRSHQGEFRLEALPGGRTRLVGTTWYSNRMWPAAYWHLWSDAIIHRIHLRVLRHIQQLAEENSG